MADVSLDELLGFISMKVFCPGNPKRNLALRSLAGTMVYEKNEYTHPVCRKAKKYTKPFGPAGAVMLSALRDWYGQDTSRCWTKMVHMFDNCSYFTILNHTTYYDEPLPIIRLNVSMLITEAAAARAAASDE